MELRLKIEIYMLYGALIGNKTYYDKESKQITEFLRKNTKISDIFSIKRVKL